MKGITRQLLIGLLGGMLACTMIAGVAAYFNIREEANELFDLQLEQLAAALPATFPSPSTSSPSDDPDDDFIIQAWDAAGRTLHVSAAELALPRFAGTGFDTVSARGERWRIFREQRHGRFVQIAQPTSVRDGLAADIALESLIPFLFLLPAVAILIGVVVFRSLGPLRRLAKDVGQRTPSALHPLPTDSLPPELQPITGALNDLLCMLDRALSAQRAFVADAAHELRSPLTALKLQLQLAEQADTPALRSVAFGKLHERLDRSTRLVHQMLTLARQDSEMTHRRMIVVDLAELVREVIADYSGTAEWKDIDLGCAAELEPAWISGAPDSLRTLLSNLVDNAIRYTPSGGRVDVHCVSNPDGVALTVRDTGPGIPADDRERVFDRFFRQEGSSDTGSGLGLAIVKGIADQHGACVVLGENPEGRGLAVTIAFANADRMR